MNNNTIAEFLEKVTALRTREELERLEKELFPGMGEEKENVRLLNAVLAAAFELVSAKEKLEAEEKSRLVALSDTERKEIALVQRLLDYNMFTYHFQPIVRADNGEIYSYEALMRAEGMPGITPFHILKYAELSHRLGEVEQYTFINVIRFLDEHPGLFRERKVFINSMPNVTVTSDKLPVITKLLEDHADRIVVEMIESSEFGDERLEEIKEHFHNMGIPIAIDDFGTGYSNISNLLRYSPDYVKLDRTLISGIQNSPNKRHLVREIVDFCHSNRIMALAEGVETAEELRAVILMGIDLIQGFYTARPAPEVINALPYELRAEIKAYHIERTDGQRLKVYQSPEGEMISLERLQKEGCSKILIGSGWSEGSVTVSGDPRLYTGMHIEIAENFKGTVFLDNAHLSNQLERPCIDIGDNSEVTLVLSGENKLANSGIRVPESSSLMLKGTGSLNIKLGNADFFGIGNDLKSTHGELLFDQDGTVEITAESHSGVGIGSGLGGKIRILRGRYVIKAMGALSIGIGALEGAADISITGCDLEAVATGAFSVAMGSSDGDVRISMLYSSIKCHSESQLSVGIGSLNGKTAVIDGESISMLVTSSGDALTALGALSNTSEINIRRSGVKLKCEGSRALLFGSYRGGTKISLTDVDLSAGLASEMRICAVAVPEDVHISGGKCHISLGDYESDKLILQGPDE
ncbi:MAG: EAL domain-containing protein [Ruminococcus sp.]|nr:EAL domain-containing protein [Ruminococcus sp.]